jgi:hypothetical protein
MPRKKKSAVETPSLPDITAKLRSGPCVPALREVVKSWQSNGRKGIADTTRTLRKPRRMGQPVVYFLQKEKKR